MSFIETIGQTQMLRAEGNRLIAAELANGARSLMRRLSAMLDKALIRIPGDNFPRLQTAARLPVTGTTGLAWRPDMDYGTKVTIR